MPTNTGISREKWQAGGGGREVEPKTRFVTGVWIFSGTMHCVDHRIGPFTFLCILNKGIPRNF